MRTGWCLAVGTVVLAGLASPGMAEELSSMARGGALYDSWFDVLDAKRPADTHKAWPASNTKKKGDVTWRCKSCHGWDLKGKDGAYASGSYQTGIGGLKALMGGDPAKVVAAIKDQTHGMGTLMSEQDMQDLAVFITKGQVDMDPLIGADKKILGGNPSQGAGYFNTICAGCHGKDGLKPKEMPPLGKLVRENPWEVLHKLQNGQPDEPMPALRALPMQISVDILSHLLTLPQER
ncbi:MAG: cytochrome c [Magnetococcus sp. WYHC-3]